MSFSKRKHGALGVARFPGKQKFKMVILWSGFWCIHRLTMQKIKILNQNCKSRGIVKSWNPETNVFFYFQTVKSWNPEINIFEICKSRNPQILKSTFSKSPNRDIFKLWNPQLVESSQLTMKKLQIVNSEHSDNNDRDIFKLWNPQLMESSNLS